MSKLRVLGIFPHPDDESYSCGGTLARMAAGGADVHVLCATAGGEGRHWNGPAKRAGSLAAVRAGELTCACLELGVAPPRLLGLADGQLGETDFPAVVGLLVSELRSVRPHIVLALGADGVYGHPDHIALHHLLIAAMASAGGGERFSEAEFGAAWSPDRLYLAAFPRGMFRPMHDHMLASEYRAYFRGADPDKLGVEPHDVVAAVDIRGYAGRKLAAIACHKSQLRDGKPLSLFPDGLVRHTLATELFTLGYGAPVAGRLKSLSEDLDQEALR